MPIRLRSRRNLPAESCQGRASRTSTRPSEGRSALASARCPFGCTCETLCSSKLTTTSPDLLQQTCLARRALDGCVVLRLGGDELRRALQCEDLLLLWIARIEREKRVGQLLDERRVEIAAHGPVVVEVGRRGRDDAYLRGVDLLLFDQLVPHRGVERAGVDPTRLDE